LDKEIQEAFGKKRGKESICRMCNEVAINCEVSGKVRFCRFLLGEKQKKSR